MVWDKTITFAAPDVGEAEARAVYDCIKSGWLTSGPLVGEFETRFAKTVGTPHAVAVNSATSAALLLLQALGVGPGDEVIVPANTFSGPAMMAHKLGAKVVVVDSDEGWLASSEGGSYQISVNEVKKHITSRTKVIMPTHFGGMSCDLMGLYKLRTGQIRLIDDAAHALPTACAGALVGGNDFSDATFFSFYPTKCLTTGDGGMITTRDADLANKIKSIRSHGFSREVFDRYTSPTASWVYDIAHSGWKANMTDMQAAMGLVQLSRLFDMFARRVQIACEYNEAFVGKVVLPSPMRFSCYHLYPMQVWARDKFIARMKELGVHPSVHFIPLPMHSFWQNELGIHPIDYPNAMNMYWREVSLPISSKLTDDEVDYVISAVNHVCEELKDVDE